MTELPAVEVFDSAQAAAAAASAAIADRLEAAIIARGVAQLCVTGGSTPGPVYDQLQDADLDWARVSVTLSDERWVDPSSPDSNARLVRERLLRGRAAAARFVCLRGEEADPVHGAWLADLKVAPLEPFDAVLLGMGADGHICSLFPGNPVLAQGLDPAGARLVLHAPAGDPAPPQDRVTLTLPALIYAGLILVLTSGQAKREILERDGDEPVHHLIRAAARGELRLLWSA
ncbi:6-phosphogluconolactonase [Caulobacter sp. NIBR1757]|uniref:6-phosphogluconolactonase n=1 Tax=Caulobacter sp. NIBR1757 TaxID=3016000 RepID=UPI0022F04B0F|nr:6-phosphogluconolactonase [Caulobacter sp. NIBR1757]WGM38148.1 6-phosphogluconolactonase [Caulobacter sp. NIBR1757]